MNPEDNRISRARYYAAIALRGAFKCDHEAIGRMVGARRPDRFVNSIQERLKADKLKWWNRGILTRIEVALKRARPQQIAAGTPPGRPFISPRQARAYAELQAAVENTARMQKRDSCD